MLATGERLPQPLKVRYDYLGGRFQLTGLRMESGQPITAAVLRSIPVGELAAAYLPHLREQFQQQDAVKDTVARFFRLDPIEAASQQRFISLLQLAVAESGETAKLTPRGRGAKPPTDAEYRAFTRIYLEERALGERGALSRTAERWGVNRSTALRWLRNLPGGLLEGGRSTNDET